jgi:hypothetical protein
VIKASPAQRRLFYAAFLAGQKSGNIFRGFPKASPLPLEEAIPPLGMNGEALSLATLFRVKESRTV